MPHGATGPSAASHTPRSSDLATPATYLESTGVRCRQNGFGRNASKSRLRTGNVNKVRGQRQRVTRERSVRVESGPGQEAGQSHRFSAKDLRRDSGRPCSCRRRGIKWCRELAGSCSGWWSGLALAAPGAPARAQSNLDAGKTPAQIFSDTCNACHRSPRELKPTSAGFLREHYTTGAREAAAMAAYVTSVGSDPSAVQHAAAAGDGGRPRPARRPAEPAKPGTEPAGLSGHCGRVRPKRSAADSAARIRRRRSGQRPYRPHPSWPVTGPAAYPSAAEE